MNLALVLRGSDEGCAPSAGDVKALPRPDDIVRFGGLAGPRLRPRSGLDRGGVGAGFMSKMVEPDVSEPMRSMRLDDGCLTG